MKWDLNFGKNLQPASEPDEIVLTDEQAAKLHRRMDASEKITFADAESAVLFLAQDRSTNK